MSGRPLVFCDANILFSATLGGPAFALLLNLARAGAVTLATSQACVVEAQTNLARKRPEKAASLASVLAVFAVSADAPEDEHVQWAIGLVHSDDVHVLASARRAGASVLLTGDTTHFGGLMTRRDLGILVRTLRAFLLQEGG